MGFEVVEFPEDMRNQVKIISLKFTPEDLDLELITRFEIGKTFEEAYESADEVNIIGFPLKKWKGLNFDDLIESKARAARAKDFLDIDQLKKNKAL
ncbi:hypothetical protein [Algoriphagus antarcticus]|uniref:Uncharacterized protein n=1 Tax=Algoriphagus antarcticus TaxID=238540 RepID=A0A3E0DTE1_9BACT|nr:hypothetical protein [Algoriphagus antarcticus]REG85402.1 hypothetical protein C8N25_11391 [Algoriphagus antarcticus]